MMNDKLKSLVVSEVIAKQLKANGFPQTSHFGWIAGCVMAFPETTIWECAAPTATEIGEELPIRCVSQRSIDNPDEYMGWTTLGNNDLIFRDENEANVRAKIWLYLKSEGLL